MIAEGANRGSSKGSQIHHMVRVVVFDQVRKGICQNQPSFGICINDFYGLSTVRLDDF